MKLICKLHDINSNAYLGIKYNNINNNNILNPFLNIAKSRILNFEELNKNLLERNNYTYHITIFNVMECNKLISKGVKCFDLVNTPVSDIEMLGIGSIFKNEKITYYIVCKSETINNIRKSYGLESKDLHITIGFYGSDLFHDRKNICNIYKK